MKRALGCLKRLFIEVSEVFLYRVRCLGGRDYFRHTDIKIETSPFGTSDGRWFLAPHRLSENPVVYSFGIGMDISFDLDLIRRCNAKVFAFDPTPISKNWLAKQALPEKFHHVDCGIGGSDGFITMGLPVGHGVSFSPLCDSDSCSNEKFPVKTLATHMSDLGHTSIDVLKMDIEGAEYEVLPNICASTVRPKQILVEFHHRMFERHEGIQKTHQAVDLLCQIGYKLFFVSGRGLEYSFILE